MPNAHCNNNHQSISSWLLQNWLLNKFNRLSWNEDNERQEESWKKTSRWPKTLHREPGTHNTTTPSSTSFGLPEQTDDHAIGPKKSMIKSLLSILMCRFKSFQQQHQIKLKTRTQKRPSNRFCFNLSLFRSDACIHEPLFVTNIRQLWWLRFGFRALLTLKHHQRIKKKKVFVTSPLH